MYIAAILNIPFLFSSISHSVIFAKDFLLNVQYVSAFNLSDKILDIYLELIEKKRLRFIMGYPGSLYYWVRAGSAAGKAGQF